VTTLAAPLRVVSWVGPDGVPDGFTQADRDELTDRYLDWVITILPGFNPHRDADLDGVWCWFDRETARKAISLIETHCSHVKGFEGPLILEPWQHGIVANLFGWKRPDGTRRFREAFVYVPRKNAKTTLIAAIAVLVGIADGEPGAEMLGAAYSREQAGMIDEQVRGMLSNSPELANRTHQIRDKVIFNRGKKNQAEWKKLPGKEKAAHGTNPHFAALDEVHTQPDRTLHDAIHTGMGARRQPLYVQMTTADYARPSLSNELLDRAMKILDGRTRSLSVLPVVFMAEREDDWTDQAVWAKANPNLHVSVNEDWLREKCAEAQENPSLENTFKRLHLNIQTEQADRWMPVEVWDRNAPDVADPGDLPSVRRAVDAIEANARNAGGFGGLDLAQTQDFNAYVVVVPGAGHDGRLGVVCRFWLPGDNLEGRERRDEVPYRKWADMGFLRLIPGEVADYRVIAQDIIDLREEMCIGPRSNVKGETIAFDRYGSQEPYRILAEDHGVPMAQMGQGYVSMSPALKSLEIAVYGSKLDHGGHPILRWMAGNAAVTRDPSDNIKLAKDKATRRIDGMQALAMAMGAYDISGVGQASVYSDPESSAWSLL
jgi:phage terminase large subunit-like protein